MLLGKEKTNENIEEFEAEIEEIGEKEPKEIDEIEDELKEMEGENKSKDVEIDANEASKLMHALNKFPKNVLYHLNYHFTSIHTIC